MAVVFFLNGFCFASWASRVPDVRDLLSLPDQQLGLLLLAISLASLTALPLSGRLVAALGAARTVRGGAVVVGLALVGTPAAASGGSVPAVAAFLFCYGLGTSSWDVAMNVEAAALERGSGRAIMSRFHAAFSLGTVAAAGLGALMSHLGVPLVAHLGAVGVLSALVVAGACGSFASTEPTAAKPGRARSAWRERRTLLLGVLVLVLALTEGVANDWLALALHDGYHVPRAVGVLGFALFVSAMTTGRLLGPVALDRLGRVPVLLVTLVLAAGGVLLTVYGGAVWLVVPGIAFWGLGASLGFPVGMSAASDTPARAAARVSVVATIAYAAFLAGPPLVGYVAGHIGTLHALLVVAAALLPALLVLPAARPDYDQGHGSAPEGKARLD